MAEQAQRLERIDERLVEGRQVGQANLHMGAFLDERIDVVEADVNGVRDRVEEAEARVERAEQESATLRQALIIAAQRMDGQTNRMNAMQQEMEDLRDQVRRLLMHHAIREHGSANPITVDDSEEEGGVISDRADRSVDGLVASIEE
jgi:chromosome segregation ATPase